MSAAEGGSPGGSGAISPAVPELDPRGAPPRGPAPAGGARRLLGWLFAGDRRVWRAALIAGLPLALLVLVWCLVPRGYYTGTDSVEDFTYIVPTPAHEPVCAGGLQIPADTAGLRLRLISRTTERPALQLQLRVGSTTSTSSIGPVRVGADRISTAIFAIAPRPATPASTPASLCLRADDLVNWGGTPTTEAAGPAPTLAGQPLVGRVAVWYLPRAGDERSYLDEAAQIFTRAALFRPGAVGAWTYAVVFLLVLPALALLALRCLAVAVAGQGRRLALWLYVIVALNACCWALITPVFQGPDEVDHFAYTQSLVERGEGPSRSPVSPLSRWSSAETDALIATGFFTDHQVGDSRMPWLESQARAYTAVAARRPARDDGGGYETSAAHGPLYYLALAPAYLATEHGSVFAQLTLMRLLSALIGALVSVFTYLLARELAPGRPWLAVLAALLVGFQPMYGFISGTVNNDVGVNAAAAAAEFLLIRLLRRGASLWWGALTALVLVALPSIKGTGESLYPAAALIILAALWRHHRRADLPGFAALVAVAAAVRALDLTNWWHPGSTAGPAAAGSNLSAVSAALHHPTAYLSYLWQVFLPRLPFMAAHFQGHAYPAFVIFVERGWGAFGFYSVYFPAWVYSVILVVMLATPLLAIAAARREWTWVRAHWMECAAVILMAVAVVAGFEGAFYTPGSHPYIAEFGRYAFPAIGPLAVLVVGSLHAFGRRRMVAVGAGLLVAMLALSYAGQLQVLTSFYA